MRALVGLLAVLLLAPAAPACPFCSWMGGRAPPLQRVLDESDVVVVAVPREADPAALPTEPDLPRVADLVAREVLKGGGRLAVGDVVTVEVTGPLRRDAPWLLAGSAADVASASLRVRPVTWEGAGLVAAMLRLPPAGAGPEEGAAARRRARLGFFLPLLQHADPVVAEAAYYEFSQASYARLLEVRDLVDPDLVLRWLGDRGAPYNRGLLYLLVGISGAERHRDALGARLGDRAARRLGLDGLLGAWLLLAGEPGLARVGEVLDAEADSPEARDLARALVVALRFHATEGGVLPAEAVRAAVRSLLARPDVADVAIFELLRLQDWGSRDAVAAAARAHGEDHPRVAMAARTFLAAAPD